jgi:hypothetical protein
VGLEVEVWVVSLENRLDGLDVILILQMGRT